jgi:hypothetical protein
VQSKFLESVKRAAERNLLELVVELDDPKKGFGYVQQADSLSNLYTFHFEFKSTAAVFHLGVDTLSAFTADNLREVEFSEAGELDRVLDEIKTGIDESADRIFPQFRALRNPPTRATASPPSTDKSFGGRPQADWAQPRRRPLTASRASEDFWASDEQTEKKTTAPANPPRSGRRKGIAMIALIAIVIVVLFVPLVGAPAGGSGCNFSRCQTGAPSLSVSPTHYFFGFGGVYLNRGIGTGLDLFVGSRALGDGTMAYGLWIGNGYCFTF